MSSPKIALFDMDNTLCDYSGSMLCCLELMASSIEPPSDLSNLTDYEEARAAVIKKIPGWWREIGRAHV